jgi:predicted DsbA family dithiol-disulfide isomerase/uncharacterized membrane protein
VRPVLWIALLRLFALVALAASAALFVDYTSPAAAFCGAGSGCAAVRGSGFGYLVVGGAPIPVPVFGLVGFSALYVASLVERPELRQKLVLALGGGGALVALLLIALQWFAIESFCTFCVVADVAAIAAGACAVLYARAAHGADDEPRSKSKPGPEADLLKTWAWVALAALAVAAPLLWPRLRPQPELPAGVLALYQPDKINVVEFADYECPFCRMLHGRLKSLVAEYPGKVNFVRLNMPLQSHPSARDAARAGVCAELQHKGDEMADRLFAAEDLSPEANRRAAQELGLDPAAFDRCVASPETDRMIDAQAKILRDAGFEGLPTTYVGSVRIIGARDEEVFRDALARAERREGEKGIPGPVFLGLLFVMIGAVIGVGRSSAKQA